MVDDGRRDMKGDGDGWYLRCCTRRRRPTRCQFLLCLFTRESPFGGVCIHMQYIIHGLYFMKRNNENDRFLFPWCDHAQCARIASLTRTLKPEGAQERAVGEGGKRRRRGVRRGMNVNLCVALQWVLFCCWWFFCA